MSNVSKEMVDAVRKARWDEWQQMAKQLQGGPHILSVEILRTRQNETAIVLTVVRNGRVVQYELRGDAKGGHARPFVSKPRAPDYKDHRDPASTEPFPPRVAAMTAMAALGSADEGFLVETIPLGEPPPKEDPPPGAQALGESLLGTTFNLGEQAVGADDSPT